MSKHKSPCRCCGDVVSKVSKRFDPSLGYVCQSCFKFSEYADRAMRKHGIAGSVIDPGRNTNAEPETP